MDVVSYTQYLLGAVVVLALLFALSAILKRAAESPRLRKWRAGRRLEIVEAIGLDPRRRLVLVRRDNVEHLLLTGGGTDVVVESGVAAAGRTETPPSDNDAQGPAGPVRRLSLAKGGETEPSA